MCILDTYISILFHILFSTLLSLPVNFKIWKKKKKNPISLRTFSVKNAPFERGSRNKENWYRGWGRAREFRRKSLTKELFNLSLHSICARVQCSWNMCVYRTTVSTQSYFCVCIRFGRLSKFDQNCYRLFSPAMRLPFNGGFLVFTGELRSHFSRLIHRYNSLKFHTLFFFKNICEKGT